MGQQNIDGSVGQAEQFARRKLAEGCDKQVEHICSALVNLACAFRLVGQSVPEQTCLAVERQLAILKKDHQEDTDGTDTD